MRRARGRAIPLALIAALGATFAAGALPAIAQEPAERPLKVEVLRLVVPETGEKLVRQGVLVKAACSQDCTLVVRVKLPQAIAKRLGLENRVIGLGSASAKADTPRWVRARLRRGAKRLLENFENGGRIQIRVHALP